MVKGNYILSILSILLVHITITHPGGPSYPIDVEKHNYTDAEGVLLQGFLSNTNNHPVDDQNQTQIYPAVIVLHDQDGPNEYEQQRATLVARELGYVGFAADIYGFGVELPPDDGGWGGPRAEFVGQYTSNATLFSTRIQAAVDYMKSLDYVDNSKIVLIGYCLGGTGIVHYLYTRGDESDVAGACGVHPSLFGDWGKPVGTINIPALFLTGGNDFLTGPSAMATLETDMGESDEDTPWETVRYAKIDHAFSNWYSEENYDARADERSWESFTNFASELFGEKIMSDAAVETNVVAANDYTDSKDGEYPLKGFAAFPNPLEDPAPVVIILPSTMNENGPGEYEKKRATKMALDNDVIAFVSDIYSHDLKDASAEALEEMYYSNTTKFMSRVHAAIDYAKTIWGADPNNIALVGFGFGGSGALMYGMGVGSEIDNAVKAIACFHGEVAKVVNATADMFSAPESNEGTAWSSGESGEAGGWGSTEGSESWGSNEASSGSWGSTESNEGAATSWGSDEGEFSTGFNASSFNQTGDIPIYPWEQRSMTAQPQILIQSGVEGDDMSNMIKLETMLIDMAANYEISRFSDAEGRFTDWDSLTYNSRATVRSFDQFESVLSEVFVRAAEEDSTVPIEELGTATNPLPESEATESESEPTETGSNSGLIVLPFVFTILFNSIVQSCLL